MVQWYLRASHCGTCCRSAISSSRPVAMPSRTPWRRISLRAWCTTACRATGCSKTCAGTPLARATWCFARRRIAWRVRGVQTLETLTALVELDHLLAAYKVPRELRHESQHTGQAFLRAAMALEPTPLVQAFWQRVQDGATPGQHAVVFGMVAQGLGVRRREHAAGLSVYCAHRAGGCRSTARAVGTV